MSNRVDFGNEGTVLHAVFIHFKVVKQNCLSLGLSIYFTSYIYQIKSPVQHSISSSQSFNIYCTPSVLSRADALDCSAKTHTNFSEHLQAPALLYMPLSTLMSNNLMSRCFMCYALCANFFKNVKNDFPLCDICPLLQQNGHYNNIIQIHLYCSGVK